MTLSMSCGYVRSHLGPSMSRSGRNQLAQDFSAAFTQLTIALADS